MRKLLTGHLSHGLGRSFRHFLTIVGVVLSTTFAWSDNYTGHVPPMGWSSWSTTADFNEPVTETFVEAEALAMHNSLQAYGYQYVNIDGGWYADPSTTVDSYGRFEAKASIFPDGIPAVATYVHQLGEKLGIYIIPGIPVAAYNANLPIPNTSYHMADITDTSTMNGGMYGLNPSNQVAVQAYFNSWANLLASWGVDYVKLDFIGGVGDSSHEPEVQAWWNAIKQCNRTMILELSNNLDVSYGDFWSQHGNGWRINTDIEAYQSNILTNWQNVAFRIHALSTGWAWWSGQNGWNDLDSLEIGNGTMDGLSLDERQTAMTMWAIGSAPFLLGADLQMLDAGDLQMLRNREVIAIDQNGLTGAPVAFSVGAGIWRAKQSCGSYALALINRGTAATTTAYWTSLGFAGPATMRNLWTGAGAGAGTSYTASLNAHASQLLLVTPQNEADQYLADASVNSLNGGAMVNPILIENQTLGVEPNNSDAANVTTNGADVTGIGNGGSLQFNNVVVGSAGVYNVTVLYINGDAGPRTANISVNGASVVTPSFPAVPAWTIGSKTIPLNLAAGTNTITFSNPTGSAPDIDSITVQSTASFNVSGSCEIQCVSSGLAVNVQYGSTSNGGNIIQWPFHGGTSSLWTFIPTSNGYYQIKNMNSGLVLAVQNSSGATAVSIVQWAFGSATGNDQWYPVQNSDGTYSFFNLCSGLPLEDPASSATQGTQFDQNVTTGTVNQKFNLILNPTGTPNLATGHYEIQCVDNALAINIANSSAVNGAAVIQALYSNSSSALWSFIPTDSGYYKIQNVNSGLVLAVQNASTSQNAPILQWQFGSSTGNDQWMPEVSANGNYVFQNRHSGLVLDIPGKSATPGTQLEQFGTNSGLYQQFNLIPRP